MVQNRRDLCLGLAALGSLAGIASLPESMLAQAGEKAPSQPTLVHSKLFPADSLPLSHSADWGESHSVVQGTLATGEFVEVHETTLNAGQMPHPPHRHTHSEFLLIRDGKLEVTSDGVHGLIEAGGVIFTASGVLHGLKNVGEQPAHYFVVAVGLQQAIPL